MSWSQSLFVLRQAAGNLRGLIWTHALTAGTMAMTLLVFGAFLLLETNLQGLLKGWGEQIQINVYLDRALQRSDLGEVEARVGALPEVSRVKLVTREQAWTDFEAALGTQANVLEGLPKDILPASLEVAVKPEFRSAAGVARLAAKLKDGKGVAAVEYPQDWIDRLGLVVLALEWVKWIIGGVLFVTMIFIVGSTVKLAVLARRDEIEIMQLVGAPRAMIMAPFVLEGMIQGIVGAGLAVLGLWGAFEAALSRLAPPESLWGAALTWQFLDWSAVALLVSLGWFLGFAGSLISLRRSLRSWRG